METDDDDNNEIDINEDFHLRLINYATYERKTFLDFLQYFIPRQTIIYIYARIYLYICMGNSLLKKYSTERKLY